MAEPLARYSMLPWTRAGIAATLAGADSPAAAAVAQLQVAISVDGEGVQMPIRLFGPGDVRSIDTSQVIRTDPLDGATDFEPNCFPAVEFRRPDLPWMFTPVANHGDHLRPWIALVVVPATAGSINRVPDSLPVLHLKAAGQQLPDLADVWATAHVQCAWVPDTTSAAPSVADQLTHLLAAEDPRIISRLLSFRRLDDATAYLACVVPTFEIGRKAGLGKDPTADDEKHLDPAWTAATTALDLPVFFSWKFSTARGGDFAALARRLERVPPQLPPTVGRRSLDATHAGYGLPTAGVLQTVGAVFPVAAAPAPWPDPPAGPFKSQLRNLINREAFADPPLVGPPLYGGWYAAQAQLPAPAPNGGWLADLNLDPRHRAAASLGAAVIHQNQEHLMASAWDQLAHLKRANQVLRQAQVARSVATATRAGHLSGLTSGSLMQISRPMHSRLLIRGSTVFTQVAGSHVPNGAFSPALRRIASPQAPLGTRLLGDGGAMPPVISRLNVGTIAVAPPRVAPKGTVDVTSVTSRAGSGFSAVSLDNATPSSFGTARGWPHPLSQVVAPVVAEATREASSVTTEAIATLRTRPSSVGWLTDGGAAGNGIPKPPGFGGLSGRLFQEMMDSFKVASIRHQAYLQRIGSLPDQPQPGLVLQVVDLDVANATDPEKTVLLSVQGRIAASPDVWSRRDPLDPMKEVPRFPQPMLYPLETISQQWVLAGLGDVPQDSVYVMEGDTAFLESYMVGLNHEMGRVLQWNDYPFLQQGTFFQQFWPANSGKTDIDEIAKWVGGRGLGLNSHAWSPKPLILVIRGALLLRYPDTAIYARQAVFQQGRRTATGARLDPIFRSHLDPDITFLGFNLTLQAAVGDANNAGWFFVMEQHPHQPRFGLKAADGVHHDPATWQDVSWSNLRPDDAHVTGLNYAPMTWPRTPSLGLPLKPAPGQTTVFKWGQDSDAGAMAGITLRDLTRVVLHASALLGGH